MLPRLGKARGQDDVETIVRDEFQRWFGGPEGGAVGRSASYAPLAQEVWEWCLRPKLRCASRRVCHTPVSTTRGS